jgi:hypothetical protein
MFLFHENNTGRNQKLKINNKFFEIVAIIKYLEAALTITIPYMKI